MPNRPSSPSRGHRSRGNSFVRSISAARDEVQSASQMLEDVQAKANAMTQALESIDARQGQIQKAEGRLSRADALMREIRTGLESLTSQRAVVDRVIAASGKLSFEAREDRKSVV